MSTIEDKRHKCSVPFLLNSQIMRGSVQPSAAVMRPSEMKNISGNSSSIIQPQNSGPHLKKSNDVFKKPPDISDRSSWSEEEEAAMILMRMKLDDSSSHAKETSEGSGHSRPQCKRRKRKKAFSRAKRQGNSKPPKSTYVGKLRRR